jgi:aminopeptidase N
MLRMMMRSEGKNPDENFLAMIREFLNEYDGKNASTGDLKRIAEKHMTKAMDVQGDKKLDWFFDEWVLGTGIPSYTLDYKIQPGPKGFVIQGSIKQAGVDDDFIMPIPVYADDQLLGRVVVGSEAGTFRFEVKSKPAKVLVDPQLTVLTQNKN